MTEAEWLACTDLITMLEFLQDRASERKLRLFTVACARLIWEKITWELLRQAVEIAERYADSTAWVLEFVASRRRVQNFFIRRQGLHEADLWFRSSPEHLQVYESCWATTFSLAGLNDLARSTDWNIGACLTGRYQPNLLRDIFGSHSFRPVALDPAWLAWHDGTIPRLAEAIYEDRELPTGNLARDRLAILADALEDAGCSDPEILGHCRGPGPHVRGCWVVDLLLGKV
jgi:hypothetical protein